MKIFKGQSKGQILLRIATVLALVSAIGYLIFGLASGTFQPVLLVLPLAGAAVGAVLCFYHGFFADYLHAVLSAVMTASLVLLIRDSVDDLTAFFVGMGNYFGNADNVGPRLTVAGIMLVCILVTIIGAFMRQEKKAA